MGAPPTWFLRKMMNKKPEILIVTPTLNQSRYLKACITSVLSQDYENKKYIILDGGSTDGSVDIIKQYSGRLEYYDSRKGESQSEAIARGFASGKGEILCWLNSDDIFLPNALACVGNYFSRHPSADVLVGASIIIDSEGKAVRNEKREAVFNPGTNQSFMDLLYDGCSGFNQPATFWRRTVYERVGGIDTTLNFSMDYDLYLKMAKHKKFSRIAAFLACFRIHKETKTTRLNDVREKEDKIIAQRYGKLSVLPTWLKTYLLFCRWKRRFLFWRMRFLLETGILNMPTGFGRFVE